MSQNAPTLRDLEHHDAFVARHIGPNDAEMAQMLEVIGYDSLDAMTDAIVPGAIKSQQPMALTGAVTEEEALARIRAMADRNQVFRSFIGQGYYGTHVPAVIARNILENPAWYTAYTPYQAEISQGRMEALLNFQTMVADLTGMEIANASLLDEATAAAEAMTLAKRSSKSKSNLFYVADTVHPQTLEVLRTRAESLDIDLQVGPIEKAIDADSYGVLVQYPDTFGRIGDHAALAEAVHARKGVVAVATDLLALTLIASPGSWGADIVIGNSQRFGVPFGFGGPHAAWLACRDAYKRSMPGRLIGISVDAEGKLAYRLTLQTREQHIRREKATSNICTAQVLLAVMAGMYAVYHGPEGLTRIARRTHRLAAILADALRSAGVEVGKDFFDTLYVSGVDARSGAGQGPRAAHQPARHRRRPHRHQPGRNQHARRRQSTGGAVRRAHRRHRRARCQHRRRAAVPGAAPGCVPDPSGVQHPPRRNRAAALHAHAGRQGSGAGPQHDPAGLVHHEAQRHGGNAADHLAGICQHPPAGAGRTDAGLQAADRRTGSDAGAVHRLRLDQHAAQLRCAGRIRRPAGHFRLSPLARRGPSPYLPDSRIGARHQPGLGADVRYEGGGHQV